VIFIIVAVQQGLDSIRESLREKGFEVVDPVSYGYPIDAIVYEGHSFPISHISSNNMPAMQEGERGSYGVLMINAASRSLEEIEGILRKRYYHPLF
jgi:hypothetical protein